MTTGRRPPSLLMQLGVGVILLQALVLLMLGWYTVSQLKAFHHRQQRLALDRLVLLLREEYRAAVEDPIDDTRRKALQDKVRRDGQNAGVRISLFFPDGAVVADSHADPATMDKNRFRPEISAAIRIGSGSGQRFSPTLDQEMMYLARPLAGEPPAVLRVAIPLTEVNDQLRGLLRVLGLAGIASLLLTSLILYSVSRRLSSTISTLADGAARLSTGDLHHRLHRPNSRELDKLATALNEMTEQLGQRIAQLNRQQNEQKAILQSMSNGVIALDRDQRILSLNRAAEQMLNAVDSRARGRLLQEVVREPALHRIVADVLAGAEPESLEFAIEGESKRQIRIRYETLTDTSGESFGMLILLEDVTELRRLESLRTDFAAAVSHELRTPITNIQGYVETLLETDGQDPAQKHRFLRVIQQNGARLAAIVDDILALTRLEQPRVEETLERSPCLIEELIRTVVSQFAPAANAKRIAVHAEVPAALTATVHRQLFEQAVGNLLSNAINYSPANTTVTVGARKLDDGTTEIAVADEGPGIPRDKQERLFERFYRVDSARSRELGGTGLGLALVKHIALVHGGQVEVESVVGKGSTFRLTIPE